MCGTGCSVLRPEQSGYLYRSFITKIINAKLVVMVLGPSVCWESIPEHLQVETNLWEHLSCRLDGDYFFDEGTDSVCVRRSPAGASRSGEQ